MGAGLAVAGADSPERRAFRHYLRTGRRLEMSAFEGSRAAAEFKFNPYHDPRNGQFTFAPGGPRSLSYVVISDRSGSPARLQFALNGSNSRGGRGGNIRAFYDPMTLQQVFPGLRNAPGGAILAVADNLLDVTGPATRLTTALTEQQSKVLIAQIQAIDPAYRFETLGTPSTLEGQINQINELRLARAAALYRIRGETRPLQVETLRFLQRRVDAVYGVGLRHLKAGRLKVTLSPNEALGNFIDRRVRDNLRKMYGRLNISIKKGEQVRVIGRAYDTSGSDRTYRVPDVRVGQIALDMTLARKTLASKQIQGFFNADFKPAAVVIVRPSQLGAGSTYVITRPGN